MKGRKVLWTLMLGVIANSGSAAEKAWSPVKPFPSQNVYYPGSESSQPCEMRVVACGTGMPQPRLKQAGSCYLVELGNGDKFIFNMGKGSTDRLAALGIPTDQLIKDAWSWDAATRESSGDRVRIVVFVLNYTAESI